MKNQDVLIRANKALKEGNYDEFITYCAEDIKWVNVGDTTFNGKTELLQYITTAYEGVAFTTENYVTEKKFVVEIGQITFVKNGESKTSSYCDIWNFKDGLISQLTSFVI